ncbi:MAG: ferredoxin [Eubacterium sp.]|nr:ferredoxin [Eubacterium sp.]
MKIELADYCIRCGICEDLYPDLYKRNYEKHCIDVLYDELPKEMEERAKKSAEDCAVAAIRLK